MWISRDYVKELERKLNEYQTGLTQKREDQEREDKLKAEAEARMLENEQRNAPVSIDWGKINAFSIERVLEHGNKGPATIIGYTVENQNRSPIIKEWVLYCSMERHEELVKQFNEQMRT